MNGEGAGGEKRAGAASRRGDAPPFVRRALGRKLASTVGGASLILGVIAAVVLIPLERSAVENAAADQLGLLAEAVAATYAVVDEVGRTHRSEGVLAQVARAPHVTAVDVINHGGEVTRSSAPVHVGQRHAVPSALRTVDIEDQALAVTYSIPWTRSCVGCHDASHDPVGAVRISVDRRAAVSSLEQFHLLGGLSLLIALVVLTVLTLVVAERFVSRPVVGLARLMARAEQGDFLVRARIGSDDEIGALGRAFNRMLKAITELKASEIEREADLERVRAELELKTELERANVALERRVRAQELLMEAAHRLSSTLDRDALLERLMAVITTKLGHADVAVLLIEEDAVRGPVLRVARASGLADREALHTASFVAGEGVAGAVAETGAPLCIADIRRPHTYRGPELEVLGAEGAILAVPMLHKGRVLGVLEFFHPIPDTFHDDEIALLQALAAQAGLAVMNADLYEQTVELSVTDPLTNLLNRRAMSRRLELELVRAQRFSQPLAVLMIDVDNFKIYNDRMGHLLGDEALQAVAATLNGAVRKVDAVARFGGEEFCVFLPRTDETAGLEVAHKLIEHVRGIELPGAKSQPLGRMSISVGLAVFPTHLPAVVDGPLAPVLLELADKAVYAAKHQGRDRAVSASEFSSDKARPDLDTPAPVVKDSSDGGAGSRSPRI